MAGKQQKRNLLYWEGLGPAQTLGSIHCLLFSEMHMFPHLWNAYQSNPLPRACWRGARGGWKQCAINCQTLGNHCHYLPQPPGPCKNSRSIGVVRRVPGVCVWGGGGPQHCNACTTFLRSNLSFLQTKSMTDFSNLNVRST